MRAQRRRNAALSPQRPEPARCASVSQREAEARRRTADGTAEETPQPTSSPPPTSKATEGRESAGTGSSSPLPLLLQPLFLSRKQALLLLFLCSEGAFLQGTQGPSSQPKPLSLPLFSFSSSSSSSLRKPPPPLSLLPAVGRKNQQWCRKAQPVPACSLFLQHAASYRAIMRAAACCRRRHHADARRAVLQNSQPAVTNSAR